MGTIGDRLGDALGQALVSRSDAAPGDAIEGAREHAQEEKNERIRRVVTEAVCAHSSVAESELHEELLLTALDLDTLSLYAVVTAVEHELGMSIEDSVVADWKTFGDILSAVGELAH